MIEYRKITSDELCADFFSNFAHEQTWNSQWVRKENTWILKKVNRSRSWSCEKRIWISDYLQEQISNGGFAIGAFLTNQCVGFISVNGVIVDTYANLTMLFIDDNFKRNGIGSELFKRAKQEALLIGAKKLFVSAIPAEETISFYSSVGCKDAEKIIPSFIDTEEDRYLEISL